jgi:hypothetical protein
VPRPPARAGFNYGPLLRLGRADEALHLLRECRQAFEDAHDIHALGTTLSALADAEDDRGHGDAAIRLERDALRYAYLAGGVAEIAYSYHNLGGYLRVHARQPALALASHLAAALIYALAETGRRQRRCSQLRRLGPGGRGRPTRIRRGRHPASYQPADPNGWP